MKKVTDYNGKYLVDEFGNVYSTRCKNGLKKLKPQQQCGYLVVDLGLNGVIKRHLVHRLIASAYLENNLNKPQVNHINGIKTDNRLENLEWATRSENQKHSINIGLRSAKGEKNSQSKLNEQSVIEIFKSNEKVKYLSRKYNVSASTISEIKRSKTWTHLTNNYKNL